ncbi:thiamine-phosphate kinase [Paenibacillus alkaliterrae]|nr:thiamine-phosphate kinase [Paenibacillus alkaliterrae]MCF2939199.1 thiamine-phosphate kinase [Paenibacillus alkaliterrae]
MDEFARIHHWTAQRQSEDWQRQRGVVIGIGDDAAVVDTAAAADGVAEPKRLLLAVDTMVETVHFKQSTMRDEDVGYKALAANISDIAAMGGVPLHALVSVSVPPSYKPERMRRLYDGLYECAERYGVAVVGGDTTSSPQHLVVAVTVTGTVEAGRELRRSGAMPGDAVFVTGAVGMAAAGLHALLAQEERGAGCKAAEEDQAVCEAIAARCDMETAQVAALLQAHQRPSPSVRAGRLLLGRGSCHSLNDVSDGLASEAWEIAEASGLRLVLEERQLPKSGSMAAYASRVSMDPLEWMLNGGEDYALLGTMTAGAAEETRAIFHKEGIPFFIIGKTEAGSPGVELVRNDLVYAGRAAGHQDYRVELKKQGYNHFSS